MTLANWTTRILVASAQADGQGSGSGRGDVQPSSAPRAVPRSLLGSRVGAYTIMKRLGEGGVGEVFKGVDVMLKREVAIKVLRHELASDPHFVERFRHEAQIHAKLSHPNVASVHAFLHEGDTQFMVMEYVPGISLDELVRCGGPVPVERALSIFRRALDGIEHAHRSGIVHRDIKPANIMLADSGAVKVMDFGIARALDSHEHLTRHGQVAGTAKSMSPEQIRGKQADVRSDIYSLGIVLYTLLAGRAPFHGESDLALMKAQLEQVPPPLHGLVDKVPPKVEAAVMRALEKDPSSRFQTVAEFSRALDAFLDDEVRAAAPRHAHEPETQTSTRTIVNPQLPDPRRLPTPGGGRTAQHAGTPLPRPAPDLPDARTSTRTVVNPELADPRRLRRRRVGKLRRLAASIGNAARQLHPAAALRALPRLNRRASALALALPALLGGALLLWPRLAQREVPAPVAETAAARIAAVSVPQAAHAAFPHAAAPRTLVIVHLPDDDTAAAGSDATHRFKPGELIRLRITPSHESHVYCYLEDEARRIVRFFPNRFSTRALVKPAQPLELPGRMRFELVANTRNVTETVACFASERDILGELPAAVVGTDFAKLPATSLDQVRSAFASVAADTLTEASFRVQFK